MALIPEAWLGRKYSRSRRHRRTGRRTRGICSFGYSNLTHLCRRRSVRAHSSYDYAIVRVVPRVEREEFINVGVIVSCPQKEFLQARIEVDESRLKALDPDIDIEAIRAASRQHPGHLRAAVAREARSANCHDASGLIGWWRLAAPSSKPRRFTRAAAPIPPPCSSICSTRWCGGLSRRQTEIQLRYPAPPACARWHC